MGSIFYCFRGETGQYDFLTSGSIINDSFGAFRVVLLTIGSLDILLLS